MGEDDVRIPNAESPQFFIVDMKTCIIMLRKFHDQLTTPLSLNQFSQFFQFACVHSSNC